MSKTLKHMEVAAWEVGRLVGKAGSADPVVAAALIRRHALRATDAPSSCAADLLLNAPVGVARLVEGHIAALRVLDEVSGPYTELVPAALDRAGLARELPESVRARLHSALDGFNPAGSTLEFAAVVAGSVIAPAPANPVAQRAASLAAAVILARAAMVPAPWLAPTRLDASGRSAAVAAERSGLWEEWTTAWCTMLAAESSELARALDVLGARMRAERTTARDQPRVGATDADVLAWLHSYSTFTIKEASAALGLTPPTVGSAIERLEAAGCATELTGQKRDRVWTSTALLELTAGG